MASLLANVLHGAHLGGGGANQQSGTANLPSIFDFLAQDSLHASIKPGIRTAIKLLGQYFPAINSTQVDRRFDEFYLLFQALLENHYLRKFSGSFAENFYGIKRVPLRAGASLAKFRHRIRSLMALVLLPYLAEKLERLHDKLKFDENPSHQRSWHRLFLRIFPRLKAFALLAIFLFQVGFTFSLCSTPSPLLYLLAGCRLEKLTPEDVAQIQLSGQAPIHMRKGSIFAWIWRLLLWLPSAAGRFLSYGLFLLQFLEYCYTDEMGKRFGQLLGGERIQVPEFPFHTLPSEQQVLCMEVNKCPICMRNRQQDTVLSVSGYVFCHPI